MKKIVLFSLIACFGFVDTGFAGNCTMSNKIGSLRDSIIFGAAGDQGLFCGASGAKTCNYSDFVLIKGKHSVVKGTSAWNAVEDFRVYKCIDVKWDAVDEWQEGHESELQTCNKERHRGYKEIGRDGNYVYLAKERLSHGSVVYAAGSKTGMCRIAISQYDPDDFCDNCGGRRETGCLYNDSRDIASYGDVLPNMDCSGTIRDPAATSCTCRCLESGAWQCDVNICSDGKTVNKSKKNISGGKGVCEEKKGNYCDKYKKYPKRHACCVAGKATRWDGNDMSDDGECVCKDKTMTWDGKKCVKKTDVTCEGMYKGNEVAIACCNNSDSSWNSDLKKCECTDENKVWDSKLKKCVEKATPVSPCTQTDCKITISQSIKCKNNSNSFNSVQTYNICKEDLDKWNIADTNCPEFQKKVNGCQNLECIADLLDQVNAYKKAIAAVCEDSPAPVYVPTTPDNTAQINVAKSTISSFFSSAESSASVWKDKDGNFNTARLASDLTAGVVLGTVGGVVSGVVIKKKQVEKGFDALHCTVGGQTVADWGDIFNVGLRR